MSAEREALRQQMLLRALWSDTDAQPELQSWSRPLPRGTPDAGLRAYRANAGALAERALASAYPTVAELVSEEAFAAMARDFWQHQAPQRGDIGEWGGELSAFIAASAQLASEPYLADSSALDWLVHVATRAADAPAAAPDLQALSAHDPAQLRLRLAPGAAVLASAWPIVAIWQAHHADSAQQPDRFAPVRAAFDAMRADNAFVWRNDFIVRVDAVDDATALFMRALIERRSLADALDLAGEGFAFEHWLARALGALWIAAVDVSASYTRAALDHDSPRKSP